MKLNIFLFTVAISFLIIPLLLSEPSFNGSTPGCGGSGCHTFLDASVSISYLGNNQVEVSVSGTTSKVGGELVDETGTVVAVNNSTNSNPFILTAPGDGAYIVNAGFDNPSRRWDSASVVIGTPLQLPAAPILVSPPNSMVFDSTTILFEWNQTQPQVTNYWIEYDTSDQFTNSFIDSTLTDTTFLKQNFETNITVYWKVKALNAAGWGDFSEVRSFSIQNPVSVFGEINTPLDYNLEQNYPNPFNPSTVIKYSIPQDGMVTLNVFNLLGEKVASLVNGLQQAGRYEVNFDASKLSSGIYLYTINAGSFNSVKKMVLMK